MPTANDISFLDRSLHPGRWTTNEKASDPDVLAH
jgi:hypothetical protein